ncbi:MAG TPA: ferritin [Thermoleophilaceae bacterium]|nr:ferritin [Thermoleophilaceae bacterium]
MPAEQFVSELNDQIGREYGAHQQYVAVAVYYDALTLPQLADFFYRQAVEERGHAMMMVQYLLDAGERPRIPGVPEPRDEFADVVEPIRIALEQEKRVTDQISALAAIAHDAHDYVSGQFMQWFLKEQVEEVATMSDLLAVAERAGDRWSEIEDYVAREHPGDEGGDPTAPTPAGGA